MDLCLLQKIKTIPNPFQKKFLTDPERQLRQQKAFDKMSFLMTMIQLVTSTNRHGYSIALNRVFRIQGGKNPPTKSAFGKLRSKISWIYFAQLCENVISDFSGHRPTFMVYRLRWEVENSFREWVETSCMEQWHSKSLNAVLQEFYAILWFINVTKIITYKCTSFSNNPLSRRYKKPNFKLIFDHMTQTVPKIYGVDSDVLSMILRP